MAALLALTLSVGLSNLVEASEKLRDAQRRHSGHQLYGYAAAQNICAVRSQPGSGPRASVLVIVWVVIYKGGERFWMRK